MKMHPLLIEPLESRIAPASLIIVNPHVATYTDSDGDHVTVKTSAGNLGTDATFTFTTAGSLAELSLGPTFTGASLAFSVVRVPGGDGLANVGFIATGGINLGNVTVAGDLGRIVVTGGTETIPAVKTLTVNSLGRLGLDSQQGLSSPTLESDFNGSLGALNVAHDDDGAYINVTGGMIGSIHIGGSLIGGSAANSGEIATSGLGNIGTIKIGQDIEGGSGSDSGTINASSNITGAVTIGGSIIGGLTANTGQILSGGNMAAVTIVHDLLGGGGASGAILSNGNLASVTVGGSIIGGSGTSGAAIFCGGNLGAVKIGQDLQAGAGGGSATINGSMNITSVTIGGSVIGGPQANSAEVQSTGNMGPVKIGLDIQGGGGSGSGNIDSGGALTSITLGGSLIGGSTTDSGQILSSDDMGKVIIAHDVLGGSGSQSGDISSGNSIAGISIGGSVIGGSGGGSGVIESQGKTGPVFVGHSVQGGSAAGAGGFYISEALSSITIGGSLIGGSFEYAGQIRCLTDGIGAVKIGQNVLGGSASGTGSIISEALSSITIGGSLIGSSGDNSGSLESNGPLGQVTIAHNVIGGSDTRAGYIESSAISGVTIGGSLIGGTAQYTGDLYSGSGGFGAIKIGGNLTGGSISGTTAALDSSGFIETEGRIASVAIGGSIIAGIDTSTATNAVLTNNASIRARDIGSITVGGSLIGNADGGSGNAASPVTISAGGQASPVGSTDLAIGKITIGGRVEDAAIFAGYDLGLNGFNASAQIGAVKVGGDWIASDLVAGATNPDIPATGALPNFGDGSDVKLGASDNPNAISKIASVTIGGEVFGTPASVNTADNYGFVAESIGTFKVGGFSIAIPAANSPLAIGETGDVDISVIT